jgi:hypothetical protein
MPTDYPRPLYQSFEGERIFFEIDEGLVRKLGSLVYASNTTMNMVLMGAYFVLLANYTCSEDIVIGIYLVRLLNAVNVEGLLAEEATHIKIREYIGHA